MNNGSRLNGEEELGSLRVLEPCSTHPAGCPGAAKGSFRSCCRLGPAQGCVAQAQVAQQLPKWLLAVGKGSQELLRVDLVPQDSVFLGWGWDLRAPWSGVGVPGAFERGLVPQGSGLLVSQSFLEWGWGPRSF